MNASSNWSRRSDRPWVLGHRGIRGEVPENTFSAFEAALAQGADGVELDVRSSRDGEIIVFHDRNLARMTSRRDNRKLSTLTYPEIAAVNLGNGDGDFGIPTLSQVLEWAGQRGTRLNIELKHDVPSPGQFVSRVVRLLKEYAAEPDRVILSSFHPFIVRALAVALPGHVVGWLIHEGQPVARHALGWRSLGARAIHPQAEILSPRLAGRLRAAGALLNTWTVNDVQKAQALAKLGVDTIISDVPGTVLEALSHGGATDRS